MAMCQSKSQDDDSPCGDQKKVALSELSAIIDSMTMRQSNSQDDDSMVRCSIEKHGISCNVAATLVGACVRVVLKGVQASRVKGACVRAVLKVRACEPC
jgi:hypothetical protein